MKINNKPETLEAIYICTKLIKNKNGINKSGIRNKGHPLWKT